MKHFLLLGLLLIAELMALVAPAQTLSSLLPARHSLAVPRNANVTATLSVPPVTGATLTLMSTQAGGKKTGVLSATGTTLSLDPTVDFRAGETLTATLTDGPGLRQVWQFTAAAAPSTGFFTYKSSVPVPGLGGLYAPLPGDMDGDGDIDLVIASHPAIGRDTIKLWLNNGLGVLTAGAAIVFPPTYGSLDAEQVRLADVEGDGDLDILFHCSFGNLRRLCVLRNSGSGTFVAQVQMPLPPNYYGGITLACGDVDGDGDVDVLTSVAQNVGNAQPEVLVGYNDGLGNFVASSNTSSIGQPGSHLLLGDLDTDGDLDLVTTTFSQNQFTIRYNDGQGSFSGTAQQTLSGLQKLILADLNGDGLLDIAALRSFTVTQNGTVTVLQNNGQGGFTFTSAAVGLQPWDLQAADLEGDGDLDLFTSSYAGAGVHMLLNQGSGQFNSFRSFGSVAYPLNMALADLDNDNDVDLVVSLERQNLAAIYLNGGTTLAAAVSAKPRLQVSPVPAHASDSWHVEWPQSGTGLATLCTALGQRIRQQAVAGSQADIPVRDLAPGLYLLTVQVAQQLPLTYRVVVD